MHFYLCATVGTADTAAVRRCHICANRHGDASDVSTCGTSPYLRNIILTASLWTIFILFTLVFVRHWLGILGCFQGRYEYCCCSTWRDTLHHLITLFCGFWFCLFALGFPKDAVLCKCFLSMCESVSWAHELSSLFLSACFFFLIFFRKEGHELGLDNIH